MPNFVARRFWKWMERRWRRSESRWTLAAYSASAWDEIGHVSPAYRKLYREAKEREAHCNRRAILCKRRAERKQ